MTSLKATTLQSAGALFWRNPMVTSQALSVLDLVQRSAELRLLRAIHGPSSVLVFALGKFIAEGMKSIGKLHRREDPSLLASPFWKLLECQDAYREAYERGREVGATELTPQTIYTSLVNGNTLVFGTSKVIVGGRREVTDDYGLPAFERRVWVSCEKKPIKLLSGITKATARAAYEEIVGSSFTGVCTLGRDPLHPYDGADEPEDWDYIDPEHVYVLD
jgi:hypothetical protein